MSEDSPWSKALRTASLFAIDPMGFGGIVVRSSAGPVCQRFLDILKDCTEADWCRLPGHIDEDRLHGGLDVVATLRSGKPIHQSGFLVNADGRIIQVPMAERLGEPIVGALVVCLDNGQVQVERDGLSTRHKTRFAVIALDEGLDDEDHVSAKLTDRLAFCVELDGIARPDRLEDELISCRQAIAEARISIKTTHIPPGYLAPLCAAAQRLGIVSFRPPLAALRCVRALAALDRRREASEADLSTAAQLILAPRATLIPEQSEPETAEPERQFNEAPPEEGELSDAQLEDMIVNASVAAIPDDLLSKLRANARSMARISRSGRAGQVRQTSNRGRPIGARKGLPRGGHRLSLIDSLRTAAPWQQARRRSIGPGWSGRLIVLPDDLRVRRFQQRSESTVVFVVDASGSTALDRLAEAKAAVELLLADCYVRREQVALIAFRKASAELLLPPTRSLVRAKRELAGLPGGGATPLAKGLEAARDLALSIRRHGQTPYLVLLTDGRPNVSLEGIGGRGQAEQDAISIARTIADSEISTLVVDTGRRPAKIAAEVAALAGGRYVPLPMADAHQLSSVIRDNGLSSRSP